MVAVASDMVGRCFRSGCCGPFRPSGSRGHPLLSIMDKDNRDDFTFAKLSDLKLPVTLRMSAVFAESTVPYRAQELRTVHSSKDPVLLALSQNFWRNRS